MPDLVVMDADMNLFTGVRTLAALIDHGYRRTVLLLARPCAPPDMDKLPVMEHLYLVDKPISTQKLCCGRCGRRWRRMRRRSCRRGRNKTQA